MSWKIVVDKLAVQLCNNVGQSWSAINFTGTTVGITVRDEDIRVEARVVKTVIEYSNAFDSEVLISKAPFDKDSGAWLELDFFVQTSSSPLYKVLPLTSIGNIQPDTRPCRRAEAGLHSSLHQAPDAVPHSGRQTGV